MSTLPLLQAAGISGAPLVDLVREFTWKGVPTERGTLHLTVGERTLDVPTFVNEFWTARQRAAHSLHEISYRACFKAQLPRFFIERLTEPGDIVYDPFMGRGTTLVEASLMGRRVSGCDINPLSQVLCGPRLDPPALADVASALESIQLDRADDLPDELLVFYHPTTLREICALRRYLLTREREGMLTPADRWIRMVAVNRLTGHSPGFFSVYTLPPNQAVSPKSQAQINRRRQQTPPYRDVRALILKKSRALLQDCAETPFSPPAGRVSPQLMTGDAAHTPTLASGSVALVVTSPPFLDVVDYQTDNWLRGWFCGIDSGAVQLTQARRLDLWTEFIARVLREVARVLRTGGHVAFEVGEVKGGAVKLEEAVVPAGAAAGLHPLLVLINAQRFTKTANCWGVTNNSKGTNTNRVVVFQKG